MVADPHLSNSDPDPPVDLVIRILPRLENKGFIKINFEFFVNKSSCKLLNQI